MCKRSAIMHTKTSMNTLVALLASVTTTTWISYDVILKTSICNKTRNGDQQRPKKRPREKTVHIGMSNRNIVTFSSTTYLYEQNTPKFPQKFIDDVRPIVSIDTALAEQSTLATLNAFHHARSFLMAALDQDQEQLATWLWTQKQHDITSREAKLLNMMKFILINFVDNCTATPISILNNTSTARKDYERTWWVRRVVPLFQTFGNQTGLLNFDWCECETTHHALEEMDLTIWEKGSSRFADGLGYDWNANERLVMEGSCGQHRESVSKTVDDSIKQLSSMIAMLKGIANIHLNARFDTMLRTKIFGVQSIKTSIVLSEVQFDENAKFSYRQVRKAEIPTSYKQRNKWLRVFELLAYLFVALDDQVVNMKQLDDEEDGAVNIPPQDTVRHKCLSV
ncbi:uncharacterized protein BX664DRAFT_343018 [Halteromyces radiatus]|uniref:uncharacterized protein n=1 Tax=Halteromyces radiatus TaxID=101107 RepID=UPI00221F788C|nr:uncharacterized protein BX664DRAFT_343018 [Halteromyces radiatus]KAI8078900.1 hypothetical protein BX664DRAFT_343018 [Halteromyces radiatus]